MDFQAKPAFLTQSIFCILSNFVPRILFLFFYMIKDFQAKPAFIDAKHILYLYNFVPRGFYRYCLDLFYFRQAYFYR